MAPSRSLVALDQSSTIIAVIEMSQSSWLVAGMLPGIERQPRKNLEPSPERLLGLLHRWQDEAVGAGGTITRIALAFEAGRDGFWLARWLETRGVHMRSINPSKRLVGRELETPRSPGGNRALYNSVSAKYRHISSDFISGLGPKVQTPCRSLRLPPARPRRV
jgi:hypothetical protein